MKKCYQLVIVMTMIAPLIHAQNYRQIKTDEYQRTLLQKTESFDPMIENQIRSFSEEPEFKKVTLPVVFHILQSEDGAKISEQQIFSQLDALNRDFGKKSYESKHEADLLEGFEEKAIDSEIQFCFAATDPDGKSSKGYEIIDSRISVWGMSQDLKSTAQGGADPWDATRYINIWVAHLADDLSGFAQMPGGPPETDGIVIDYRYFGVGGTAPAPYDQGKTLTHLIGNYLGLFDLWGPCECCDDGVSDTPIHNAPNYRQVSEYKHISTCAGNPVEMSMNFMDNTDDAWMYMFTNGQKLRMQAMLSEGGARYQLVNALSVCTGNTAMYSPAIPETTQRATISDFDLFPNPTKGTSTLRFAVKAAGSCELLVRNTNGQVVYRDQQILSEGQHTRILDGRNWPGGVYWISIRLPEQSFSKKLILLQP